MFIRTCFATGFGSWRRSCACVPWSGQMKPEQAEIAALRKEVAKLKMERDILKKAAAWFAKEST